MSINNCQAIQESGILIASLTLNLRSARLRERDLGFFRAVTIFKLLKNRQSELRESSEPIMYKISYNKSTEKFQAIQKKFFIISMRSKIVTPESRHLTHFLWSVTLTLGAKFLAQVRSLLISGFIQWRSTLALHLTVRCSFYPSLFTVVYCISIRSVKRQASKADKSVVR